MAHEAREIRPVGTGAHLQGAALQGLAARPLPARRGEPARGDGEGRERCRHTGGDGLPHFEGQVGP